MLVNILLLILLLCGCAHQDEWTTADTWRQVGVSTILIADAITTTRIQYNPNLHEVGPIARHVLGSQPSTSDTYLYFGTVIISNYLVSRALPSEWRPFWQLINAVNHSRAVINNCGNELC